MEKLTVTKVEELVENLKEGQVLLTFIRPIKGDMFSVEFAEKINNPHANTLLNNANPDDARFSNLSSNARRGWANFNEKGLLVTLGISLKDRELVDKVSIDGVVHKVYVIGQVNPIDRVNKTRIRLEISETTTPTEKQLGNVTPEKAYKQDGNGNYLLSGNRLIYSRVNPTNAVPVHKRVIHDAMTRDIIPYLIPDDVIQAEEAFGTVGSDIELSAVEK